MSDPNPTPAQQEFNDLVASAARDSYRGHPEDRPGTSTSTDELDEEDAFRAAQIDAAMRMPTLDGARSAAAPLRLPPASFDSGRATGVKGVIADARSYEAARRSKWATKAHRVRRSIFGLDDPEADGAGGRVRADSTRSDARSRSDSAASGTDDEAAHLSPDALEDDSSDFIEQWREARRKELESGAPVIRNRRTSPSIRTYGRLDEVDALGYLDAVEKVRSETVVVVFVTDLEVSPCSASSVCCTPLVRDFLGVTPPDPRSRPSCLFEPSLTLLPPAVRRVRHR
jgi:hypothetical protein